MKRQKIPLWILASGTLLLAVLERVILALFYAPVTYHDTASYRRSADAILHGWAGYDGTRTPGYPAFMALFGSDHHVYLAQLALGLLMTLIFFYLGWKLSGRLAFGLLAALIHTLNLGQLFFEADLITENSSTFFIVLALVGAFIWLAYPKRRSIWLAIAIGVAASVATLIRPLFIFLPFWTALFLAVSFQGKRIEIHWQPLLGVVIPSLLLIGGWVYYIDTNFHILSVTTMNGYHLVQHTGNFFQYVPDQYAALRDTYLKYRAQRIAKYGTQGNTIWDAIPEMQRVSGQSFYELSRTLQAISIDLILHHPFLYLQNVASGWWMFWRAPFYWAPDQITPILSGLMQGLAFLERIVLVGINMLFLIASGLLAAWPRFRRAGRVTTFGWLVMSTIWVTSIVQTLLDHGDNPRFLVPLQTWVVLWVAWLGYMVYTSGFFNRKKEILNS